VLGDIDKTVPNSGHYALAELEASGILRCTITQNVDGLHEKAGTKNLLEYHGSLLKLRCVSCTPGLGGTSLTWKSSGGRTGCLRAVRMWRAGKDR